jgi:hypothetical protein
MEDRLKLYKITFYTVGHGHKPTLQIVAPDVETAINKAREMNDKEWEGARVGWCDTITFVDGVA